MKMRSTFILVLMTLGLAACSKKITSGLSDQSENERAVNSSAVSNMGTNVTSTTSGRPQAMDLNRLNEDVILSIDSSRSNKESFKKSEQ